MRQKRIFALLGCISVFVLLVSGCASRQSTNAGSGNTTSPTPTVTANATVPLQGVPTHTPITPVPTVVQGPIVSGQVTVMLDKKQYAASDKITALITNGLSSSIVVMDHQSSCTVLTLQMQASSFWSKQASCQLSTVTRLITIPAKSSLVQSLSPGARTFANAIAWPKGQYRLVLSYATGSFDTGHQGNFGPFTPIYSATFTVG